MPNQKKKQHTAEFKAKVVKEILKEEKIVSQLSAEYGIHSSQLYKWKDRVLIGLPNLFSERQNGCKPRLDHSCQRSAHQSVGGRKPPAPAPT
jgi:Transposase